MNQEQAQQALIDCARRLASHGWLRATSGNLSLRVSEHPLTVAVTRSGSDKAHLHAADILGIAEDVVVWGQGRPSAEFGIHQAIYQLTTAGAVLHVHTVANNLVSDLVETPFICITDNEMIKALGFWDDAAQVRLPLIENPANLDQLARAARSAIVPAVPGLLIRHHGLYAFGPTLSDAVRHLEAWEFLFEWQIARAHLRSHE